MKKLQTLTLLAALTIGSMTLLNSCAKDLCKDVVCENGGNCVEGDCDCLDGYEGTLCETQIRTKFQGTWQVTESCDQTPDLTYSITIGPHSTQVTQVNITNFWNAFVDNPVVASVTTNTITIASQQPDNDGWIVVGSGTLNTSVTPNTIDWEFTVTDTNDDPDWINQCTAASVKL